MVEKGTEFLPPYIQMIIKKSGGIGFENLGRNRKNNIKMFLRRGRLL